MKRVIVGSLSLTLAALFVSSARKNGPEQRDHAAPVSADRDRVSTEPVTPPPTLRYELFLEQELGSKLALRAIVEITPRDRLNRDLVALSSVHIEGEGAPAARELVLTFARFYERNGAVEAVGIPRGVSEDARRWIKAIASALQFTPASSSTDPAWEANELDVGGRFAARYRRIDDRNVERVERRFLGNPADRDGRVAMKLSGVTRFTFDENRQLRALATEERAELSATDAWRMEARLHVELTSIGETAKRLSAIGLERDSLIASVAPAAGDADRTRLGGRSLHELREELRTADSVRERSRLLLDHAALIRTDSSIATELAARIADEATPDTELAVLAGALAAAGTIEASYALTEVLAEAKRPYTRAQAAVSLNLASRHDDATIAALEQAMRDEDDEVAGASMLALGSAIRRTGGNAEAAKLLERAYTEAMTAEARIGVLRAIGNSGDASLLAIIERALAEPSTEVQLEAAYAMRFMDPRADAVLARVLSSPQLPEVRDAAVRAMSFRTPAG